MNNKQKKRKYDVFISYRKDGGEYSARVLYEELSKRGYRVFFDVETLRSGYFNTRLYQVIEECDDFLMVLSPGALDRCVNEDDWVRQELGCALKNQKNVIPVMLRNFQFPKEMPAEIEAVRYRHGISADTELSLVCCSCRGAGCSSWHPDLSAQFQKK